MSLFHPMTIFLDCQSLAHLFEDSSAGDSSRCRDLVLANEMPPRLYQISVVASHNLLLSRTIWKTRPALPALQRLVHSNNEEVLTDAYWALFYLSDGTNDKIQAVIDANVCQHLVELLLHPSPSVLIPARRTDGNIVTGDDVQTQVYCHE